MPFSDTQAFKHISAGFLLGRLRSVTGEFRGMSLPSGGKGFLADFLSAFGGEGGGAAFRPLSPCLFGRKITIDNLGESASLAGVLNGDYVIKSLEGLFPSQNMHIPSSGMFHISALPQATSYVESCSFHHGFDSIDQASICINKPYPSLYFRIAALAFAKYVSFAIYKCRNIGKLLFWGHGVHYGVVYAIR